MDRHVLTHSKEKPIVCPFPSCNKSFKRPYALKEHIQLNHTETTAFPCPLGCHLKFPNHISLKFHLGKHEFIKDRARKSKEGQDIDVCVPWKRVVQWERDWWNKHKPDYTLDPQSQPAYTEKSIFDLDILAFLTPCGQNISKMISPKLKSFLERFFYSRPKSGAHYSLFKSHQSRVLNRQDFYNFRFSDF